MCKITGSTATEIIYRENELNNYDYLPIFIYFLCVFLLLARI